MPAAFIASLVPIAFAYAVAHYFSLLVFDGQNLIALASDPFGRGWDLFGTIDQTVNYRLVSVRTIALVQAGAIVVGHVSGVLVAHDRAVERYRPNLAVRSQYPLLAVMIAYTVGGLAILLPILAVAALSWAAAMDYHARSHTFEETLAFHGRDSGCLPHFRLNPRP